jgi:hypothetical protein
LVAVASTFARKTTRRAVRAFFRIERETTVALERAREAGNVGQAKNWLEDQERVLRTTRATPALMTTSM